MCGVNVEHRVPEVAELERAPQVVHGHGSSASHVDEEGSLESAEDGHPDIPRGLRCERQRVHENRGLTVHGARAGGRRYPRESWLLVAGAVHAARVEAGPLERLGHPRSDLTGAEDRRERTAGAGRAEGAPLAARLLLPVLGQMVRIGEYICEDVEPHLARHVAHGAGEEDGAGEIAQGRRQCVNARHHRMDPRDPRSVEAFR
jgi:hypothetical protein